MRRKLGNIFHMDYNFSLSLSRAVCFSSDDSTIASGSSGSIRLWSRLSHPHNPHSSHILTPSHPHTLTQVNSSHSTHSAVGSRSLSDLCTRRQTHRGRNKGSPCYSMTSSLHHSLSRGRYSCLRWGQVTSYRVCSPILERYGDWMLVLTDMEW